MDAARDDQRARSRGARTIALVQRLHFVRNFQPSMTDARARRTAERADPVVHDVSVRAFADLGPAALVTAAWEAVRAWEQR